MAGRGSAQASRVIDRAGARLVCSTAPIPGHQHSPRACPPRRRPLPDQRPWREDQSASAMIAFAVASSKTRGDPLELAIWSDLPASAVSSGEQALSSDPQCARGVATAPSRSCLL